MCVVVVALVLLFLPLRLIFVGFFLAFVFYAVHAHFLVVLLERGQIFARLGELALFHALAHVPETG